MDAQTLTHAMTQEALAEKALWVHARLCAEYGCPVPFFRHDDPLEELISALLSHRTKNSDTAKSFNALKERFGTWEAVRDAPTGDVEACIRFSRWPEQKAPRIQQMLREITARQGDLSLWFLGNLPLEEARAWLDSLPGVGPKTVAATLLFSALRRPVMPVDSHHHRVALRLGLIAPTVGEARAHVLLSDLLPEGWDAQQVYDHHEVLMFHGQRCCYFRKPDCHRCVVLDVCPTGQARLEPA
jgi:endonuclease-3